MMVAMEEEHDEDPQFRAGTVKVHEGQGRRRKRISLRGTVISPRSRGAGGPTRSARSPSASASGGRSRSSPHVGKVELVRSAGAPRAAVLLRSLTSRRSSRRARGESGVKRGPEIEPKPRPETPKRGEAVAFGRLALRRDARRRLSARLIG